MNFALPRIDRITFRPQICVGNRLANPKTQIARMGAKLKQDLARYSFCYPRHDKPVAIPTIGLAKRLARDCRDLQLTERRMRCIGIPTNPVQALLLWDLRTSASCTQ